MSNELLSTQICALANQRFTKFEAKLTEKLEPIQNDLKEIQYHIEEIRTDLKKIQDDMKKIQSFAKEMYYSSGCKRLLQGSVSLLSRGLFLVRSPSQVSVNSAFPPSFRITVNKNRISSRFFSAAPAAQSAKPSEGKQPEKKANDQKKVEKPADAKQQQKGKEQKPEQKKEETKVESKTEAKAEAPKGVKIPVRVEKLVDELMTFNLIEMKAFIETVARKLGIPEGQFMSPLTNPFAYAAPPPGIIPPPQPGQAQAPGQQAPAQGAAPPTGGSKKAEPQKTVFAIKLVKVGDDVKFKVLKEIRTLKPGMNIAESKKFVDQLPSILKEGATKEEADKWIAVIKAAGGEAVLD